MRGGSAGGWGGSNGGGAASTALPADGEIIGCERRNRSDAPRDIGCGGYVQGRFLRAAVKGAFEDTAMDAGFYRAGGRQGRSAERSK